MKAKLTLAYLALTIPALLIAAIIWTFVAPDRFYHCWDVMPLVTFVPPFVHPESPLNGTEFDYYVLPEATVYLIWSFFVAAALLIPALPTLLLARLWRYCKRHDLLQLSAPTPITKISPPHSTAVE